MIEINEIGIKELLKTNPKFNMILTRYLRYTYLYLLVRFKLQYRQISIITHCDFDGLISAAIVLQKSPYSRIYFSSPRNLHNVIYRIKHKCSSEIPHSIYILDLGIEDVYLTRLIKAIRNIRKRALVEIIWIDHHESPHLKEIRKYVHIFTDPTASHTAFIVNKIVNNDPKADQILDILRNVKTPFAEYWQFVLKAMFRTIYNIDLRICVLRTLASFTQTILTDKLYERECQYIPPNPSPIKTIYVTQQGFRFGFLKFNGYSDLYPKVIEIFRNIRLDFLLVQFENGTLSAYKAQRSRVDLVPIFKLVGGKGHAYAFHFDPQVRITEEFFQPVSVPELIAKIQEVI